MAKKKLIGIVVSTKCPKTLVVKVERIVEHKKYKKHYRVHKKYKVHCETGEYHPDDKVIVEECRPISKDKHWRVIGFADKKDN